MPRLLIPRVREIRFVAERNAKGVQATVGGEEVLVGKPGWLEAVGVVVNDELVGLIGMGDEVKSDAKATVDRMTDAGITPVMITGDDERTAEAVASEVGIERVMANVLNRQCLQEGEWGWFRGDHGVPLGTPSVSSFVSR